MTAPASRSSRTRAGRRWLVIGIAAVLLMWIATLLWLAWGAWHDIQGGTRAARTVERLIDPSSLRDGSVGRTVATAARRFDRADHRLHNPAFLPVRLLPVLGRQYESARSLSRVAAHAARATEEAVATGTQVFEQGHLTGAERVAALRSLADASDRAATRLEGQDYGPSQGLVGTLARQRAEVVAKVDKAHTALRRAARVGQAAAALLGGPRRVLVLAANNAEMRAGSGMFLTASVLETSGGRLRFVERSHTTAGLVLDDPVPAPPELAARWGFLEPTREWRNLNATPRFDTVGPLAASMWKARRGEDVDAVVAVDVAAIEGILGRIGAVDAEGLRVDGANARRTLLLDQYDGIDVYDPAANEEIARRRERLGAIAEATLTAVDEGRFDLADLADALTKAVQGRHLMVWTSPPAEQAAWAEAGATGALRSDSVLLSVLNRGTNKLDQFLAVHATLERDAAGDRRYALHVRLRNAAPGGLPGYVSGPGRGVSLAKNEYAGILAVTLPAASRNATIDGDPPLLVAGPDGPTRVIGTEVRLRRGDIREVVIRFDVAPGLDHVRVEPSARLPAVAWSTPRLRWNDTEAHTVPLP